MKSSLLKYFSTLEEKFHISTLACNILNAYVTLHTKTRLIKHGNFGKTGFQKGFQRVSNSPNWVSKGFQIPETGFVKSFKWVCNEFQRVSNSQNPGF